MDMPDTSNPKKMKTRALLPPQQKIKLPPGTSKKPDKHTTYLRGRNKQTLLLS
jgi:hypothetical protein